MKRIFHIIFMLFVVSAIAQESVTVQDSETGEPLIGAAVLIESKDGETDQQISDGEGKVSTALPLPFEVEVRYVGYQNQKFKISKPNQAIRITSSQTALEEVVVTGQFQPQSAKNSVYKVRSITSDRITAQNANSIHDVLSNELNIRISRDNAVGRSGISLQGLDAQYTKVLLDGAPVIGRGGIDNDIDLGQIDVNTIERIEIVEGPMAVNYGADALAGVINIITKKDIDQKLEINTTIQTETAGDQYELFDQGIYSPSLSVGYKINDKWFTQVTGRLYQFGGWEDEDLADELGEFDWHPKRQWFGGWMTRYAVKDWEIFYRLGVLDELIENRGDLFEPDDGGEPYRFDEDYEAKRFIHQLQSDLKIGERASLNNLISYTDYERLSLNYRRFPISGAEVNRFDENDTIYYRSFFTRNILNNLLATDNRSLQVGVETTRETSSGSTLSAGDKHLTDIAVFTSAEFIMGNLKVRPGIRYSYNSLFETIPTPSINFSFQPTKQTHLRWSYGRGFRAPSIRELYHEFIDSNHNIIGNQDLTTENSHNFNLDVTHDLDKAPISFNVSAFYNEINDGIIILTPEGSAATTYVNLNTNKTLGGNFRINFTYQSLQASAGVSHIGRYQRLRDIESVPDFVYATEVVSRIQYTFSQPRITLSSFYKYTGPLKRYSFIEDEAELVGQEGFHTLDFNATKSFGESFRLGLGVRNALNVTRVNATGGGGAHTGGDSAPVGFGRSYFLTLNYQFKK